jgi:outer membrane protein
MNYFDQRSLGTPKVVPGLPGSARVPRAGFGVPPKQSFLRAIRQEKSAKARTPSPARGTRALPRPCLRHALFATALIACANITDAITLDALLQQTMQNNPAIQSAKSNLEQAAGQRLVIHSALLPKAIVGSVVGVEGGHRAGEKSVQPFGAGYGNFTQPLFHVAGPALWRRGNLEVLIAQQQLNVAVVDQLHAARVAFYTALYHRDLTALQREQRQRLQENTYTQEARYQAGQADRSAFIGAGVQTRALDPDIAYAERAYEGALLQLSEAVGQDFSRNAIEPEGILPSSGVNVSIETATAMVLHRPDLELARLFVRAAGEDQRVIEAGYYPAITANISGEYIPVTGVRREQGTGSPHRSDDIISSELRLGAGYTWRVVDNGKVYGAVERKRAVREANEATLKQMEQQVPRDLSRIQNDFGAIAMKEKELKNASFAAGQNAEGFRKNLDQGISSQLEYRLAQNDLLKVQTGLLKLAYQRSLALAEWDRVTGRYLRFTNEAR